MPKLPDRMDLGSSIPRSQRTVLSYRPGVEASAFEEGVRGVARAESAVYDSKQNLLKTFQDTGAKFEDLAQVRQEKQNKIELASARSNFIKADLATRTALEQDPDYTNYTSKYTEQMRKARETALGQISDPDVRAQYEIESDLDVERGRADMTSKAYSKEKDAKIAWGYNNIEDLKKVASTATDDATRQKAFHEINVTADVMGEYGMSEVDKLKLKRDSAKDVVTDRAYVMPPSEKVKVFAPHAVHDGTEMFTKVANEEGVDPEFLLKTASIETGGTFDASAKNPKSSATGMFQFTNATAKQYGLADPTDPVASAKAYSKMTVDNKKYLAGYLNRDPSNAELYLAGQQGPAGAAALLANPKENAVAVLTKVYNGDSQTAQNAILNNGGTSDMTSGEFAQKWATEYESRSVPDNIQIPVYGKTGTEFDILSNREKKEMYDQGLSGLETQHKNEQLQFQQSTRDFLTSVLPKVEQAGGDWSVLSPAEQKTASDLNLLQQVKGYKGEDSTAVLSYLYELSPQDRMTAIDTPQVMLGLSQDTWQSFKKEQSEAADPSKSKLAQSRDDLVKQSWSALSMKLPSDYKSDTPYKAKAEAEFSRFNQLLNTDIDAFTKANKRAPDNSELQGLIDAQLLPKALGTQNRDGTRQPVRTYDFKIDDIPPADLQAIDATMTRRGMAKTNAGRIRMWLQKNEAQSRAPETEAPASADQVLNMLTKMSG